MTDKENFLSRWSRLKREPDPETPAVEAEDVSRVSGAAAEAVQVPDDEEARVVAALADPESAAGEREGEPHPAELIDIDALTKESDFSAFVKKGVPAALQRKALRKLWTLDPVLANLDGLNDYENIIEEFGITDLKPGGSGWQTGRGFMTDEDFAKINKRGGYLSPETDEPEQPVELAEDSSDADLETTGADIPADTGADDEFDVGGGDEEA